MTRHTFTFMVRSWANGETTEKTYTSAGATWEDCYSAALSRARAHGTVDTMMMKVGRTK